MPYNTSKGQICLVLYLVIGKNTTTSLSSVLLSVLPGQGGSLPSPPSVKCRVKLIELLLEGEEVSEFLGADKMVSSAVLHMKHL